MTGLCSEIRQLLRERPSMTRAEIVQATGCTDVQAGNALGHLLREEVVYVLDKKRRYGCGPANVYALRRDGRGFDDSTLRAVLG